MTDRAFDRSKDARSRVTELTDGFSFAYLKELMLSSTMRWMDEPARGSLTDTMLRQIALLREQMSEAAPPPGTERSRQAVQDDD